MCHVLDMSPTNPIDGVWTDPVKRDCCADDSAGSYATPQLVRSLSSEQALQVVRNEYFNDDDDVAVCCHYSHR